MGGARASFLHHILPQRHEMAASPATYTDILQDQQTPAFSHILITPASDFSNGKVDKAAIHASVALRLTFLDGHH